MLALKTRYLDDSDKFFNISLAAQETKHFYIHAQTDGMMILNLSLWQQEDYIKKRVNYNLSLNVFGSHARISINTVNFISYH